MGKRKRERAEVLKEQKAQRYDAALNKVPTSPRKMRLVADLVRGMDVDKALFVLKLHPKEASNRLEKLLLSAIANYGAKSGSQSTDGLFIKSIMVDGGRTLRRLQTAPQGRGYRLRKRSNHVALELALRN